MRSSCKGNATVVMERRDYDTSTYHKLPKDPTPTQESKISRKLRSLHNGKEMTAKLYNRLRSSGSQPLGYMAYPKFTRNLTFLGPLFHASGHPHTKF